MKWFGGAFLIVMGLCWAAFSGTCTVGAVSEPGEPFELRFAVAVGSGVSALIGLIVAWIGVTMVRKSQGK